ncbi:hypothetical protein [Candidatus Poriferisodalis sp.]|uniref:hypothetical protein n=1 Tax=Candidatus Poriferisodalis sp. TaxID=3101277 RepID=UPI003B011F85
MDSDSLIDQFDLELLDLDAWAADPRLPDSIRNSDIETVAVPLSPTIEVAQVQGCTVELRRWRHWSVSADELRSSTHAVVRVHDTLAFSSSICWRVGSISWVTTPFAPRW